MNPEIEKRMEKYVPKLEAEKWAEWRPLILKLVRRADPGSEAGATAIAAALVKMATWAESKGLEVVEENLLDKPTAKWFISDASFGSPGTRDSYASALARVRRGGNRSLDEESHRHALMPPYTRREQDALIALGTYQAGKKSAVMVESLVRLGLGAGLAPGEAREVCPDDLCEIGGVVTVRVGEGDDERRIGVLAEHGPRLMELAEEARKLGLRSLVGGNAARGVRNAISRTRLRLNGAENIPDLSAQRLRHTWLVTQLAAGTSFQAIVEAAGDRVAARLIEFLVWLPPMDEMERNKTLAAAESWTGQTLTKMQAESAG